MKIAKAFQSMQDKDFFNILTQVIVEDKISSERLNYMIGHVIRNFRYKQLTIADIVSIDIKCKLYTRQQVYDMEGEFPSDRYEKLHISGINKPFYVSLQDKQKHKIPDKL